MTFARPCIRFSSPRRPSAPSTWRATASGLLTPEIAFAHPLDDEHAAAVGGSVGDVAGTLEHRWTGLRAPIRTLVRDLDKILPAFLGSMRSVPAPPLAAGTFGLAGLDLRPPDGRALRHRRGARPGGGHRRPRHAVPLTAPLSGRLPPSLHGPGPPLRLARGRRGQRRHRRCADRRAHRIGRSRRDRPPGEEPGRPPGRPGHGPRRHAAPAARPGGRTRLRSRPQSVVPVPATAPASAKSTGPSAARCPGPARRCPRHGDPPRGRDVRGDRPQRGRRGARAPRRAALLPGDPALPRRPDPGSGREPHAVGLLPRPQRVRRRHDRAHGGPDRAVRPGLSRPRRGAASTP